VSDDAREMSVLFKQGYRGSRFSFGYRVPNLEDQAILLDSSAHPRSASTMSRAPALAEQSHPRSCAPPEREVLHDLNADPILAAAACAPDRSRQLRRARHMFRLRRGSDDEAMPGIPGSRAPAARKDRDARATALAGRRFHPQLIESKANAHKSCLTGHSSPHRPSSSIVGGAQPCDGPAQRRSRALRIAADVLRHLASGPTRRLPGLRASPRGPNGA